MPLVFLGLMAYGAHAKDVPSTMTPLEECLAHCDINSYLCKKDHPKGEERMNCVEAFSKCKMRCEERPKNEKKAK